MAFNIGDIKEFVNEYKTRKNIEGELTLDEYGVFSEQLKDRFDNMSYMTPHDANIVLYSGSSGNFGAWEVVKNATANSNVNLTYISDFYAGKLMRGIEFFQVFIIVNFVCNTIIFVIYNPLSHCTLQPPKWGMVRRLL
jgi:hypothetical protein